MNRRIAVVYTLVFLILFSATAFAAPLPEPLVGDTIVYAEAVNLPGWLGGLMAVISILLPLGVFQWMRQNDS